MFTKGMGISDGIYHMKLDGKHLRLELTEDGKERQKQELREQKVAISNKHQQQCVDVLVRVSKLITKIDSFYEEESLQIWFKNVE